MSPSDTSTTPTTAHQGTASTISKLEDKLEGMNLHNTEDVDQTTNYARPVTKEIVKPVVHEQVEEHITREIHAHDVYHKILPVRDVEVLPARHWVPGPDGRLIQVDEKDVYSGAAWSVGQTNATSVSAGEQDQREVQPGHARQTQLHHSEAEEYQIPRKPVGQDNGNAGHIAFVDVPASRTQYEAAPNQVHQGRDDQSHEYSRHQDRVADPQATQSQINPSSHRKTSQPLPSPSRPTVLPNTQQRTKPPTANITERKGSSTTNRRKTTTRSRIGGTRNVASNTQTSIQGTTTMSMEEAMWINDTSTKIRLTLRIIATTIRLRTAAR
ncbi:hypothetical protein NKR19_g10321 [Coniochaeta hoffmannii]|uniref:Uncharacterized protein n=1 Tax=Coniochaeta hoffmannii TaxID=91930 RepID=A0AA38R8Q8_9PEZI|nr:hypothetical protein NKR19_g10321 [Coniochaeta hoffmannii]